MARGTSACGIQGARALVALLLLHASGHAAAVSCPELAAPVCGADGLTYFNDCLAKFQGVTVVNQGYCAGHILSFTGSADAGARAATAAAAVNSKRKHRMVPKERAVAELSEDVMTAFTTDGFSYLGKIALSKAPSLGGKPGAAQHAKPLAAALGKESASKVKPASSSSSSSAAGAAAASASADAATSGGGSEAADIAATLQASAIKIRNGHLVLPGHVSALRYTPEGHIYAMKQARRVVQERGAAIRPAAAGSSARGSSAGSSAAAGAAAVREEQQVIMPNIPPSVLLAAGGSAGASNSSDAAAPLSSSSSSRQHHARSLSLIVGSDDRKQCPSGAPYPFSAIGQIDFLERQVPFICTGTLLTPSLVLTAAHCVWDIDTQAFVDMVTFAPGRYRTANGTVVNPHGQYKWSHATLMKSYLTSGEGLADIALIKLDGAAPKEAGTMGLKSDCTGASAEEKALPVTTAGYPSDKPDGECATDGCAVDFKCSSESTRHSCDTYMGQSGSAFWDAKFFIRGVHVRGLLDENVNEFTTIGPKVLGKIKEWEGQDNAATAAAAAARSAALAAGKGPSEVEQAGVRAGTAVSAPGLNSAQR